MSESAVLTLPTTAQATVHASVDDASINALVAAFFCKHKDLLAFRKSISFTILEKPYIVDIEVAATQAPVLTLGAVAESEFVRRVCSDLGVSSAHVADTITTNVVFTLDGLRISMAVNGDVPRTLDVRAEMAGFLCTREGKLSIQSVSGKITADGQPDPIASMVFDVVVSILRDRVNGYPLPNIQEMGFQIQLQSVGIEDRSIACTLTGSPAAALSSLLVDTAAHPRLRMGSPCATLRMDANDALANMMVKQFLTLPGFSETAQTSAGGFGVRAQVMGGVQTPSITFNPSMATASTEIGFRASVGVQAFGSWLDIGVTPFNAYVRLDCDIATADAGKTLVLRLAPNFDSLKIDFGITLPGFLSILLHPIQDLLASLVRLILPQISSSFLKIPIPIYTVKQPMEVYDVDLDWSFGEFAIKSGLLQAAVNVTAK